MNKNIEIVRETRKNLLNLISDLTVEELNEVPKGFNNNIIWNVGHIVAAQQGVCYKRANVDMVIDEAIFLSYKPDTKPEKFVTAEEVEVIKTLLLSAIDQLEIDYNNNLFANYIPWKNRYGVMINNIDELLCFLPFHEGLHYGYVTALKRIVKTK
jgi:hypothetical protein